LFSPVAPLTTSIHAKALVIARERELSVYDALIIAAALDARCELLAIAKHRKAKKLLRAREAQTLVSAAAPSRGNCPEMRSHICGMCDITLV